MPSSAVVTQAVAMPVLATRVSTGDTAADGAPAQPEIHPPHPRTAVLFSMGFLGLEATPMADVMLNGGGTGGQGRGGLAYACTKGAIIALHRGLAKSLGAHNIRVNSVAPGSTTTAMTADYSKDAIKRVADRTALGRMGKAEEIAAAAIFLASDAASYITGEQLNVNGGGSFGV